MRNFVIAIAFFVLHAAAFEQNSVLVELPDNTALDLGNYADQCRISVPDDPDNCRRIGDYSRFTYDPDNHQILWFGGGHASTMRDDVDVFSFDSLKWAGAYPSTLCSEMNTITEDGAWSSTGNPVSRHTYDQLIYAPNVHRLLITSPVYGAGYCGTYGGCGEWCRGKMFFYDPVEKTWSIGTTPANDAHTWSSEYDPASGMIISAGSGGLLVYDPVNDVQTQPLSGSAISGYADNLVYFPPNQKMYYIQRGDPTRVFEVTLDRNDWENSTIAEVTDMTGTPGSQESGFAYDTANYIIGGGVRDGIFYAFDPLTGQWDARTMQIQGGSGSPTLYFHNLDYDPVNGVFIFSGEDFHTWAYCYQRSVSSVSRPAPLQPVLYGKPAVTINPVHTSLLFKIPNYDPAVQYILRVHDLSGRLVNDISGVVRGPEVRWKVPDKLTGLLLLRLSVQENR
jgi:hypothetical protein